MDFEHPTKRGNPFNHATYQNPTKSCQKKSWILNTLPKGGRLAREILILLK